MKTNLEADLVITRARVDTLERAIIALNLQIIAAGDLLKTFRALLSASELVDAEAFDEVIAARAKYYSDVVKDSDPETRQAGKVVSDAMLQMGMMTDPKDGEPHFTVIKGGKA